MHVWPCTLCGGRRRPRLELGIVGALTAPKGQLSNAQKPHNTEFLGKWRHVGDSGRAAVAGSGTGRRADERVGWAGRPSSGRRSSLACRAHRPWAGRRSPTCSHGGIFVLARVGPLGVGRAPRLAGVRIVASRLSLLLCVTAHLRALRPSRVLRARLVARSFAFALLDPRRRVSAKQRQRQKARQTGGRRGGRVVWRARTRACESGERRAVVQACGWDGHGGP